MKSKYFLHKVAVLFASLLLLIMGILLLRDQYWLPGTVSMILAMGGLLYTIRTFESTPFNQEDLDDLRPIIVPGLLWTIILGLSFLSVYYVSDNLLSKETDQLARMAWITSVILGVIVSWTNGGKSQVIRLIEKMKVNRNELVAVLILVLIAFGLRIINLSIHPYPWSGDEASIGSEGIRILNGEITNFFDVGWSIQPNWSFVPTAIAEAIFGKSLIAIRLPSALAGTLAVLFVYLAGRELFNPTVALLAAAYLASYPIQVHFSRVGVHNVVDSLMSSMVFWLLARGINNKDARYYYLAGAVAGLSLYTYAGTKLVLILGVVVLLFMAARHKGYIAAHWKHVLNFGLGTLVSLAPQAAYFARHPDSLMGRFGQEGIFFNGWLANQLNSTQMSALEILFSQLSRTFLVFIATPALGNFFNSPYPYLTVLGSVLFLVGMGYALTYMLNWRYFVLLLWFWMVVLFGGVLTLNPPANTRLLMTSPAVALMMALGTWKLFEYLKKLKIVPERVALSIIAVVVVIVTFQNVRFYMYEYQEKGYFQDANGEFALEAGLISQEQGPEFQIFVLGAPRIFAGFPTLAYLAPGNTRLDVTAENLRSLPIDPNKDAGFFAIPENIGLLDEINQMYPGGERGRVYRKPVPDEILFEYYIIERPLLFR